MEQQENNVRNPYSEFVQDVWKKPAVKIAVYSVVLIGGIYLLSLGSKIIASSIRNFKEVKQALNE